MPPGGRQGLRVNGRLTLPPDELRTSYARSGGPGGQNVNKVATKVVLRFSVARSQALGDWRKERLLERLASRLTNEGELVIHASRHRERHRNEEDARERLAQMIRDALQPVRARRATRPTRGLKERRLAEKKRRSQVKRDRSRRSSPTMSSRASPHGT